MNPPKPLPIGQSSFEIIRKQNYYWVDKSRLIQKVVDNPANVVLLPRPRRFGKTLNMDMLRCFFSNDGDRASLFSGRVMGQSCIFLYHSMPMTCKINVCCPQCGNDHITHAGKSASGEQRRREQDCPTITFMLNYRYTAYQPGIKEQIIDMAINGSGVRDTARILKISKGTVTSALKKVPDARSGKPQLSTYAGRKH